MTISLTKPQTASVALLLPQLYFCQSHRSPVTQPRESVGSLFTAKVAPIRFQDHKTPQHQPRYPSLVADLLAATLTF